MVDAPRSGSTVPAFPGFSAVEYPVLRRLGKQSIRRFLLDRVSYEREIEERKKQEGITNGTPVSPVISVEASVLESLVELRLLGESTADVKDVTVEVVGRWLDSHREVKKDALSASQVTAIISRSLRLNFAEKDPEQRIIMLFADYSGLLWSNGLSWVLKEHPKMAVAHIVEAIRPATLQKRLREDLEFSYAPLKRDFLGFMKHVISRTEHYNESEPLETSSSATKKTTISTTHQNNQNHTCFGGRRNLGQRFATNIAHDSAEAAGSDNRTLIRKKTIT
jgi:hypothetical protein